VKLIGFERRTAPDSMSEFLIAHADDCRSLDDLTRLEDRFTQEMGRPPTDIRMSRCLLVYLVQTDLRHTRPAPIVPDCEKPGEISGMRITFDASFDRYEVEVYAEVTSAEKRRNFNPDDCYPWKILQVNGRPTPVYGEQVVRPGHVARVLEEHNIPKQGPQTIICSKQDAPVFRSLLAKIANGAKLALFGHGDKPKQRRQPEKEPDWFKDRHTSMDEFKKKYGGK